MRTVYREQMDNLAHDLITMCDHVHGMHRSACKALFDGDLDAAEAVLSSLDKLDEYRVSAEDRAFELLAREAPVARDLRQVVSGIYIVEDMARMGALSVHIANTARRRHPDNVLPEQVEGFFREMASVSDKMTSETREVLIDYDVNRALRINDEDDGIDDIHSHLFTLTTGDDWPHTSAQTVDVTLLSRYFERYADHAVAVAARIVYLATGYKQEDYMRELDSEERRASFTKRLSELERHFKS
ncbi:phosphate signaling complex protein PhoU [uncultured Corynebacterium sp.]|uniref:phosphate signaling complex protein PhoU n=1 Tax=uncultured Corynebacterium sp. TaxID=159447 RepID=UPI0025CC7A55|nr:phosphate signaling complex protein PhoU [uncultured Corynebacterium sp.]